MIFLLATLATGLRAQKKYTTRNAKIDFISEAQLELIKAASTSARGLIDPTTNQFAFTIEVNSFQGFNSTLQREHFNEKYMDTEKFPKASFKGKISGFDPAAGGVQQAKATGKMNIHGVEKDVEIPGTIEKSGDKLLLKSKFIVKLEDYKVDRPQLLWQNIAEQVEVTVDFVFKPQ